jgi:hypothetical protein
LLSSRTKAPNSWAVSAEPACCATVWSSPEPTPESYAATDAHGSPEQGDYPPIGRSDHAAGRPSSQRGDGATGKRSEDPGVSGLELVPLALAAAVYPTLLAGVILILSRPNPLRMLIGFLAGGMAISIAAGYAIVSALESSDVVSKSNSSNKPIVDIVVGAISLLVAWGVWSGHIKRSGRKHARTEKDKSDKQRPSLTSRALGRGSITMAFIAGLVLNLPGVWYLDALAGIAKRKPSNASALVQILAFNLIMFALVEIPIVAYLVNPRRAGQFATNLSDAVHTHSRTIAIVLAIAVGIWLLTRGIVDLVK